MLTVIELLGLEPEPGPLIQFQRTIGQIIEAEIAPMTDLIRPIPAKSQILLLQYFHWIGYRGQFHETNVRENSSQLERNYLLRSKSTRKFLLKFAHETDPSYKLCSGMSDIRFLILR